MYRYWKPCNTFVCAVVAPAHGQDLNFQMWYLIIFSLNDLLATGLRSIPFFACQDTLLLVFIVFSSLISIFVYLSSIYCRTLSFHWNLLLFHYSFLLYTYKPVYTCLNLTYMYNYIANWQLTRRGLWSTSLIFCTHNIEHFIVSTCRL